MRSDLTSSTDRSIEELMISLDQLTQKLEVRLAQAQRLKTLLYQRTASTLPADISPAEQAELDRLREASLKLLSMQASPASKSLH